VKRSSAWLQGLRDESGSAIIEFLVVALPLFVPLVWFITSVTGIGVSSYDASEYARNLLRVYITSPSAELLQSRVDAVTQEYKQYFYPRDKLIEFPQYSIICAQTPCLTPGRKITVTVTFNQQNKSPPLITSVSGYVDSWSGA